MSEFKIVYAIDDNVYKLAAVSMASVLLNNINSDIEIIILQSSLCQEAFAEFNKLFEDPFEGDEFNYFDLENDEVVFNEFNKWIVEKSQIKRCIDWFRL